MSEVDQSPRLDRTALGQLLAGLAAVRGGDFGVRLTATGDPQVDEIVVVFNGMAEQLDLFTSEVTRVAREVGTDGKLGGQAYVPGVSGTWQDLTESVNAMARNLTAQVRGIAQVTTSVARGDLTRKIDVDARGEVLELKSTINTMVDQLSSFAAEVTRVAREVGREGRLGGEAEVEGVSGIWKRLTENVNELAGNLTLQVRAISGVASAVAAGDLTRSITVEARGEVAELKDNINVMVRSLRDSVQASHEQDWLQTNLARFSGMLQGHRDLRVVADLIMTELAPLVDAQHGTFFVADDSGEETRLRLVAGYGLRADKDAPIQYRIGQSLIGQVAKSKRPIVVDEIRPGYIRITSGLGEAPPTTLAVLPIIFEDHVLGVLELATFGTFSRVQTDFLEQLTETLGVTVNALIASSRTDALLAQSQRLTAELRARSEELQRSNADLADKAELLAKQKRDIEAKNAEIERARAEIEQHARQLALASAHKSQFLANMSHELRTPLNSLLILARLLAQNPGANLTAKQVEYANVIHSAGSDLLQLINDILDLSKVEAGRMDVHPARFALRALMEDLQATFGPLVAEKGLRFEVETSHPVPAELFTDQQRLRQVVANLLSNAIKFTERGTVALRVGAADNDPGCLVLSVTDTGIGIAPENLAVIFGAFQQGDGTLSRRYGGTGLGLSIAREVAALLGGEITADSRLGSGTTFTLGVPSALPGAVDRDGQDEPDGGSRRRNVLVYERSAEGVCTLLARSAVTDLDSGDEIVTIRTASTPEQGATMLAAEQAQCVVADLGTPSALEFLEHVQQSPALRDTPVLAYLSETEHAAVQPRLQALRSGAATVEVLPSLEDLSERITVHLSAGGHAALRGRKVLVIDDDERNVFAIASALELHGARVARAGDGRAGIDALIADPGTDIVLLDIMMPGMDGYATLTVIRQMPQFTGLPVVVVTARATPADRDKSLRAGANECVTKPVDIEELLTCVERLLARG